MKITKNIILTILCLVLLTTVGLSQVNQYTGDAVQSIPVTSLGGIDVTLNYNGNVRRLVYANNKDLQSGWVGLGWSLNLGSIVADINGSKDTTDDKYYLVGPDGGSELIHYSGNEFRMKEYQYWKIFRTVDASGNIIGWTIQRNNGTVYRYGNLDTASRVFKKSFLPTNATRMNIAFGGLVSSPLNKYYSDTANIVKNVPYQWDLSDIEFVNGTHSRIIYQQEQSTLASGNTRTPIYYTRESHPKYIIDRSGRHIVFELGSLSAVEYVVPSDSVQQYYYEKKYLSAIYVKTTDSVLLRQIDFNYYPGSISGSTQTKRYLTSIVQKDSKGKALPSQKIKYVGINGESNGANLGALKSITSPNGGVFDYAYQFKTINTNLQYTRSYPVNSSSPVESENDVKSSGTVGSDFVVIKLKNNILDVVRWTHLGWTSDSDFPITGSIVSYKVAGDYVVVKENSTTVKVAKRVDDGWELYTVSPDTIGSNMEILGLAGNYFVVSHNPKTENGDSIAAISVFKIIPGGLSKTKISQYRYTYGYPIYATCLPNYFILQWSNSGYQPRPQQSYTVWFNDNDVWRNNVLSNGDNTWLPSPNVLKIHPGSSDYFHYSYIGSILKWNGSVFQYPGEDAWVGDSAIIQSNYFVVTSSGYHYIASWLADSITSPVRTVKIDSLSKKFYVTNTVLPEAKIVAGQDFIAVGWYENGTTGKLGITQYRNGSWGNGQTFSFPGKKVTPYFCNGDVIISLDSTGPYPYDFKTIKHQLKVFKQQNDIWVENEEIETVTNIPYTWSLINTQSSGGSIVDLVETGQNDNQKTLYLYKKGFGQDSVIMYKGNQAGVYVVSTLTLNDGFGNILVSKYDYEQGAFAEGLSFAKFNRVTSFPPGNIGKTETYFYNDRNSADSALDFVDVYNFRRLDGLAYRTKTYNSSGSLLSESKTNWALRWVDSTTKISEKRVLSTESTIDGVKTIRKYEYNNSNGLVSRTTDSLFNVKTDRGNNQNVVTEINYAFESHQTGMNSSGKNMLVYPFETKVYEKDANNTLTLRSDKQTFYSPAVPYYVTSSKLFDSTQWITTDSVVNRDTYGNVIESKNIDGVLTTTKWGFNNQIPYATIVNSKNSQSFIGMCEEYKSVSPNGMLALGFDIDNSTAGTITYSAAKNGVAGSSQKIVLSSSSSGGMAGVLINLGVLDSTSYIIEYDYLLTQGEFVVYTIGGSGGNGIQATYIVSTPAKWKHAKIYWNITTPPLNARVFFRVNNDGLSSVPATTFYLDNVRIYPANAFCSSSTIDPITLRTNATTNANGVTSVSTSDGFGRATQGKQ